MSTSLFGMGWRRTGFIAGLMLNLHPLTLSGQGVTREFREVHMGLEVSITAHGPARQLEAAATAAFARIATLEQLLSDWRPTSELNQVTHHAAGQWQPISKELESVLSRALEVAAASDGAFDPTIGALTQLWREERRSGVLTDSARIAAARRTVDWRGVQLDTTQHRIKLTTAGTRLDLGGIAKGWILDQARATMAAHGFSAALIEAGGDLVAGDAPPTADGWRINVRTAHGDSVIVIQRVALATSGPAAQTSVAADGVGRSHVIDPATGRGLTNGVEVTVMANDGATADAVATALTVMPEERWGPLLARFGVRIVAVVSGQP